MLYKNVYHVASFFALLESKTFHIGEDIEVVSLRHIHFVQLIESLGIYRGRLKSLHVLQHSGGERFVEDNGRSFAIQCS